ncbi:MAG TPA: hypothetical protein VJQ82_05825, partial [Terriglobales bacterium]|nr:hypothetical protein [Terriglobales bacterium]
KLLTSHLDDATGSACWCEFPNKLTGGNFATVGDVTSAFTAGPDANGMVNGVQITPSKPVVAAFRVIVEGDFIRDQKNDGRGLDADHLPPWLPGRPTGDGIEGGTFVSWLNVTQQ